MNEKGIGYMQDLLFVFMTVFFFVLSIVYTYACGRL
jgi:hypothetical protein